MREHDAQAMPEHDAGVDATYVRTQRTDALTQIHSPWEPLSPNASPAGGQNEFTRSTLCALCEQHPTSDILCAACIAKAHQYARDIAELTGALEDTITRQTRGATGPSIGRTKQTSPPLPFADNPHIRAALADLGVLVQWAAHIAGRAGSAPSTAPATARARTAALAISHATGWFRIAVDAPVAVEQLATCRAHLQRAVDRQPARFNIGPCGAAVYALDVLATDGTTIWPGLREATCDATLYAEPGRTLARCRSCQAVHHAIDRDAARRAAMLDALDDTLVTLPELNGLLDVLPTLMRCTVARGTFRQWRHRGKLAVVAVAVENRADLYRAGDLIALARKAEAA
jgi:hypothetical protein